MTLGVQRTLRACAFVALLCLLAWPWPAREAQIARVLGVVANPVLNHLDLGGRVNAQLSPLPTAAKTTGQQHVVADSALYITARRTTGQAALGLALRRDVYLPAVLFLALMLVVKGRWRRKLIAVPAGLALIAGAGVAAIAALVCHYAAHQLPQYFSVSSAQMGFIDFVYERGLAPPGNRVVAPLLLAAAFLIWARPSVSKRSSERGSDKPSSASAKELPFNSTPAASTAGD